MIIKGIELSNLSREEYLNLVMSMLYYFKLEWDNFTEEEKNKIEEVMKKKESEWNKKI